jgi:hypothetical protein
MCIVTICRICGDRFPATDLRKTVCDKPECRLAMRNEKCWRKHDLTCEWCGKPIPPGSGRKKYCCKECGVLGGRRQHRIYHKENQAQVNLNQRIRRGSAKADVEST